MLEQVLFYHRAADTNEMEKELPSLEIGKGSSVEVEKRERMKRSGGKHVEIFIKMESRPAKQTRPRRMLQTQENCNIRGRDNRHDTSTANLLQHEETKNITT